jgi:hypothetical protein
MLLFTWLGPLRIALDRPTRVPRSPRPPRRPHPPPALSCLSAPCTVPLSRIQHCARAQPLRPGPVSTRPRLSAAAPASTAPHRLPCSQSAPHAREACAAAVVHKARSHRARAVPVHAASSLRGTLPAAPPLKTDSAARWQDFSPLRHFPSPAPTQRPTCPPLPPVHRLPLAGPFLPRRWPLPLRRCHRPAPS